MAQHSDLHRIRVRWRTAPQRAQNPANDHQRDRVHHHNIEPAAPHLHRPGRHSDVAPHTPPPAPRCVLTDSLADTVPARGAGTLRPLGRQGPRWSWRAGPPSYRWGCGYCGRRRWKERMRGFWMTPSLISMARRRVSLASHALGPPSMGRRYGSSASLISQVAESQRYDGLWSTA